MNWPPGLQAVDAIAVNGQRGPPGQGGSGKAPLASPFLLLVPRSGPGHRASPGSRFLTFCLGADAVRHNHQTVFTDKSREPTDLLWASPFLFSNLKVWGHAHFKVQTGFGGQRRTRGTAVGCSETPVQTQL